MALAPPLLLAVSPNGLLAPPRPARAEKLLPPLRLPSKALASTPASVINGPKGLEARKDAASPPLRLLASKPPLLALLASATVLAAIPVGSLDDIAADDPESAGAPLVLDAPEKAPPLANGLPPLPLLLSLPLGAPPAMLLDEPALVAAEKMLDCPG